LLAPETGALDPISELLLMFAARRENVTQVIEPALSAGQDVICDRFTDASYAYQGGGRSLGHTPIDHLVEVVHPNLTPDLVLLLDVPVDVGLSRIQNRAGGPDRFEADRGEFLERVRQAYLARARQHPEYFELIDASQHQEQVRSAIRHAIQARLLT
ncbi:MAG: dTMP kinase, partial [Pseudomonadota bacterium]